MQRATKIVATLGPASSDPAVLKRMLAAGVGLMWATRHVAHSEGFSGGGIAGFIGGLLILLIFLLYPLAGVVIVRHVPSFF